MQRNHLFSKVFSLLFCLLAAYTCIIIVIIYDGILICDIISRHVFLSHVLFLYSFLDKFSQINF